MEDNRLVTQKNSSFLALSVVSCSPILVSKQENVVNFVTNDTDSLKVERRKTYFQKRWWSNKNKLHVSKYFIKTNIWSQVQGVPISFILCNWSSKVRWSIKVSKEFMPQNSIFASSYRFVDQIQLLILRNQSTSRFR